MDTHYCYRPKTIPKTKYAISPISDACSSLEKADYHRSSRRGLAEINVNTVAFNGPADRAPKRLRTWDPGLGLMQGLFVLHLRHMGRWRW